MRLWPLWMHRWGVCGQGEHVSHVRVCAGRVDAWV